MGPKRSPPPSSAWVYVGNQGVAKFEQCTVRAVSIVRMSPWHLHNSLTGILPAPVCLMISKYSCTCKNGAENVTLVRAKVGKRDVLGPGGKVANCPPMAHHSNGSHTHGQHTNPCIDVCRMRFTPQQLQRSHAQCVAASGVGLHTSHFSPAPQPLEAFPMSPAHATYNIDYSHRNVPVCAKRMVTALDVHEQAHS